MTLDGIGGAEDASSDYRRIRRPRVSGCGCKRLEQSLASRYHVNITVFKLSCFQRNLKAELFARSYPDA